MDEFTAQGIGSPNPEEILHSMLAPDRSSVFVLGTFEKRITLYHQQVRALNLAYALHTLGYCRNSHVAVVGTGAAGLTIAAALSLCPDCEVKLFEHEDRVLPVLDQGGERYLSPILYEWPGVKAGAEAYDRFTRTTPMTGWPEGLQCTVVDWLKAEWEKYKSRIKTHFRTVGLSFVEPPADGSGRKKNVGLGWYSMDTPGKEESAGFDLVILALGFGLETTIPPVPLQSYWQKDDLEELVSDGRSILVSGAGDGGWTDVFRTTLPEFHQTKIANEYLGRRFVSRQTRNELIQLETEAQQERRLGRDPSAMLTAAYSKMETGDLELHLKAESERASKTKVVLNARHHYVDLDSFLANRFLGSRLIRAGILEHWPGRITDIRRAGEQYRVVLNNGSSRIFDHVVIRHGVAPALRRFDESLFDRWEPALRKVALLDRTNLPAWPPRYFEESITGPGRSLGLPPDRVKTLDTIEAYSLAVRHQRMSTKTRGVCLAAARPNFVPVDGDSAQPEEFAAVVANSPCAVVYDNWDNYLADVWCGAVTAFATWEPVRLKLPRPYVPIILTSESLERARKQAGQAAGLFEALKFVIQEESGLEIEPEELRKWPAQAEFAFLIIFRFDLGVHDGDRENFAWLLKRVGTEGSLAIIVLQKSSECLPAKSLGLAKAYRFQQVKRHAWQELSADLPAQKKEAVGEILNRLFKGELTWSLIELAIEVYTSEMQAGCQTREDFGAWCVRHVRTHCEGDGALAEAALPALGYYLAVHNKGELLSANAYSTPREEVVEFLVGEFRQDKAAVNRMLEELIRLGFLRERRPNNGFSVAGPTLAIVDDFFHVYLAVQYLVGHAEILAGHLREPVGRGFLRHVLILALKTQRNQASELLAPLMDDLKWGNLRFPAEATASEVELSAEQKAKVVDALINPEAGFSRKIFDMLARLVNQDSRVISKLQSLVGTVDPQDPWTAMTAAVSLFKATGDQRLLDRLAEFATGGEIDGITRLRTIERLREMHEDGFARTAALALAKEGSQSATIRIRSAGEGAAMGDSDCTNLLVGFARDPNLSEGEREQAASELRRKRADCRKEAIEAWWALFENGTEQSVRSSALAMLLCNMAQFGSADLIVARLTDIARAGAPEDRWWAIQELVHFAANHIIPGAALLLAADPKVPGKIRLDATRQLFDTPSHRTAVCEILENLVRADDLEVAVRIEAARSLGQLPEATISQEVREILQKIAAEGKVSYADRATAIAVYAAYESRDAAISALVQLATESDHFLWLACGKELGKLNALADARIVLMKVVAEGTDPRAMSEAIWTLARQRQFDELEAACRAGEIPQSLWGVANSVCMEMGNRSLPASFLRDIASDLPL